MGNMINTYKLLENLKEDLLKMNLKEIWCKGMDWIHLAQGRIQSQALVNILITFHVL
jgi:hypothetical protein